MTENGKSKLKRKQKNQPAKTTVLNEFIIEYRTSKCDSNTFVELISVYHIVLNGGKS